MKKSYLFFLLGLSFFLTGCISVKTENQVTGGLYRSRDAGMTFEQVGSSETSKAPFANENISALAFDPSDPATIYFASEQSGLYVTNDTGASWKNILRNKGIVKKVLVELGEPCHLYVQTNQNILKSINCGRTWETPFIQRQKNVIINDMTFDHTDQNRLYVALSDGSLLVSDDLAISWSVLTRLSEGATRLFINPKIPSIQYAATAKSLYRSYDQGFSWENLGPIIIKDFGFKAGNIVTDLAFVSEYDDGVIIASQYGLLKSMDSGVTWEEIELIPQPKKETILSLVVNPDTMDKLYYSTAKTIYYSEDGGATWITRQSPSPRRNEVLALHPANPAILYVGVLQPQK